MSNPQARLDELLVLSDTELDRLAAECQGWEMREMRPGISCAFREPGGCTGFTYSPSTSLSQAWELADFESDYYWARYEGGDFGLTRYAKIGFGADDTLMVVDRKDYSPARILTAFGIIARETTPK